MEATAHETITPEKALSMLQDQLQMFLTTIKEQTGIPGISLGLNIGSQKITANVGTISIDSDITMTDNTHFQLGCISKLMTALVAAELITAGKLDPDDPIGKYLDELRGTERGKDIQIWHLLSHTSGYSEVDISDPGVSYYYSWPKFVEYLNTATQLFKPGTVFNYIHSESVILGEIVKRITGNDIFDLYNEIIIKPLKLTTGSIKSNQRGDISYAIDHKFNSETMKVEPLKSIPMGDFWSASLNSLTMSTQDILTLASTICGISKPPSGISEKALQFVQKQVIKVPRTYGSSMSEQVAVAFGAGCAFYRGWIYGLNGSARSQTTGLRFDPHNKIAMVISLNMWKPFLRDSIINYIFGRLRGQSIETSHQEPFEMSLSELAGTYIGSKGLQVIVTCEDDQIIISKQVKKSQPVRFVMKKDEKGILRVQSDMQHFSIGFFHEPESGIDGLMLGPNAFRKQ
ncbi:MAG: beta-lactamase family protein [Desulfatiglans sp.]|jgi:CubicO group peptidase (beta-lactamase class C family)|nr:beta-lactamase family protein [Desulfatiglans sp.]